MKKSPPPALVISGGTRGIGNAISVLFAKKGYEVIISARNKDNLAKVKEEIEQDFNVACHIFCADSSVEKEVKQFTDYINGLNVNVKLLINNAGCFIPGSICDEKDGQLQQMIETNLYSAYHLTRGLLSLLRKNHEHKSPAHIFNITSVAGQKAYPNGGSYSISKFAMIGFTENLREELREEGIRVTNVVPGAVYTDSWAGFEGPTERLIPAEDIALAIWNAYELSHRTMIEDIVLRPQKGDL